LPVHRHDRGQAWRFDGTWGVEQSSGVRHAVLRRSRPLQACGSIDRLVDAVLNENRRPAYGLRSRIESHCVELALAREDQRTVRITRIESIFDQKLALSGLQRFHPHL